MPTMEKDSEATQAPWMRVFAFAGPHNGAFSDNRLPSAINRVKAKDGLGSALGGKRTLDL